MSLLFERLRVHTVFGANTDVGKTILTTALCRSAAFQAKPVFYLKPVSTGPPEQADNRHIGMFGGPQNKLIFNQCLYQYDVPVSPHLAAMLGNKNQSNSAVPSDSEFVKRIASSIQTYARVIEESAYAYVETAGGVHSPTLSGTTQADAYRPLRLPVILIGDSRLGGISATISSYESLMLRGYDIDAVLMFEDSYYQNSDYLGKWFQKKRIDLVAFPPPPGRSKDPEEDRAALERYYASLCDNSSTEGVARISARLDRVHAKRLSNLASMPARTLESVWWPFTQHGIVNDEAEVMVIDSAIGDFFMTATSPRESPQSKPDAGSSSEISNTGLLAPVFDGSASWWTQAFGHANTELTMAAAYAAGRYGHVMFPMATHEPALRLAERLIRNGPGKGWASRAFFSDDGSTGIEVALKMATRSVLLRQVTSLSRANPGKDLGVLGLQGSYHGDTLGAMDASEGSVYNRAVPWYRGRGYWFDPPAVGVFRGVPQVRGPPRRLENAGWSLANEIDRSSIPNLQWESLQWRVDFASLSDIYDVETRMHSPLADAYKHYISFELERLSQEGYSFGALVLEPLLMGAGGMIFVDPLFQRVLIDVVRASSFVLRTESHVEPPSTPSDGRSWVGLPVIFDEVFVGLQRLGCQPKTILGTNPDIAVYAKVLTGGLLPMAVTLASDDIFRTFWSDRKVDALLHGHSYTAHPVGCAVANKTLDLLKELEKSDSWASAKRSWTASLVGTRSQGATTAEEPTPTLESPRAAGLPGIWSLWDPSFVTEVSRAEGVTQAMAMGTVLAIHLAVPPGSETKYTANIGQEFLSCMREVRSNDGTALNWPIGGAAVGCAIHSRTLGDVVYFISSLNTSHDVIGITQAIIRETLKVWQSRKA